MAEISRKSNGNSEESIIKKRGMSQWQRQTPKEEQYKQIVSKMPPEEREKERKLRIQENRMSEFHRGGVQREYPEPRKEYAGKGIRQTYVERKEMSEYLTPKEQEEMNKFVGQFKGEELKEIEARLKGYHSAAERKEIRTRIGRETQHEAEKRYQEQHYDPAGRYKETVGAVKHKLGIVKEDIKKLATPAGLAGGIIGVVSPKMTLKEKITAEREKIAKEQKLQKRRELMEKRQHEVVVAAAYGSGRIPKQIRAKPRKSPQAVFLGGFGNVGGFNAGNARPVARPISQRRVEVVRTQPQVVDNPFGLTESGIVSPIQRPAPRQVVRQLVSVRPTEKVVRTERQTQKVEYRPQPQFYNPVNNPQANFLVNMGGMESGNSPVSTKKKSVDTTGASAYW